LRGKGTAFGATTIVNAMPSGFGAALGVRLRTSAEVEIDVSDVTGTVEVQINSCDGSAASDSNSGSNERTALAKESFSAVMRRFGLNYGGKIRTSSEIPIARGMKSSSAASNAIVIATLDALGERIKSFEAINLAVEASLAAKASITGAFDDACASYFGNLHVTDNYRRKILRSYSDIEKLSIIFLVPDEKRYSGEINVGKVRSPRLTEIPLRDALNARYWQAMLLNGLIMSRVFGIDASPIITALQNGAISAGLCGKGPAVCAVSKGGEEGAIIDGWKTTGHAVIQSEVNTEWTAGVNAGAGSGAFP